MQWQTTKREVVEIAREGFIEEMAFKLEIRWIQRYQSSGELWVRPL